MKVSATVKVSAGFVPLLIGLGWCLSPRAGCDVPTAVGNRATQPSMAKSNRLSHPRVSFHWEHKCFHLGILRELCAPQFLCLQPPTVPGHGHRATLMACLQSRKEREKMTKGTFPSFKEIKERKKKERLLQTPRSSHTASSDITSLNASARLHPCSQKPGFLWKIHRTVTCKPFAFPKGLRNDGVKYRKGRKTRATGGSLTIMA